MVAAVPRDVATTAATAREVIPEAGDWAASCRVMRLMRGLLGISSFVGADSDARLITRACSTVWQLPLSWLLQPSGARGLTAYGALPGSVVLKGRGRDARSNFSQSPRAPISD